MQYDYLIVGAGLFGAVFARQATDAGKRCLVIDKRTHIAGNCYTEPRHGIAVHKFGPHIFHTNSAKVWDYVNRFTTFNRFTYRPRVLYDGRIFSFPINLMTLHQVWGVRSPAEARARLAAVTQGADEGSSPEGGDGSNLKSWLLSQVGPELYRIFYEGYTTKQWGRDPALLPASIGKRVPIRLTFDDNYFDDRYQGIPTGGYTSLVAALLEGIEVKLRCDYFADVPHFQQVARRTVYAGPIDRFFHHCHGRLEYRSLRFEEEEMPGDFQGVAAVNCTGLDVPYTRIVEHKHFEFLKTDRTVITREYPVPSEPDVEPFYPVNDARNNALYARYREMADASPVLFGGRLGAYKYYDMDQVIGQALAAFERDRARPA